MNPSLTLQRGEQYEAHDPACGLTYRVAGRGIADIARLEHGQRPAVHHHVLGGGQEEQDREHDGQGEDVRYEDILEDEVMVLGLGKTLYIVSFSRESGVGCCWRGGVSQECRDEL